MGQSRLNFRLIWGPCLISFEQKPGVNGFDGRDCSNTLSLNGGLRSAAANALIELNRTVSWPSSFCAVSDFSPPVLSWPPEEPFAFTTVSRVVYCLHCHPSYLYHSLRSRWMGLFILTRDKKPHKRTAYNDINTAYPRMSTELAQHSLIHDLSLQEPHSNCG